MPVDPNVTALQGGGGGGGGGGKAGIGKPPGAPAPMTAADRRRQSVALFEPKGADEEEEGPGDCKQS